MHVEVFVKVRKKSAFDYQNVETAEFGLEGTVPVLMAADWGPACGCLIQNTIKRASRIFKKVEAEELAKATREALAETVAAAIVENAQDVPLRPPDKTGP